MKKTVILIEIISIIVIITSISIILYPKITDKITQDKLTIQNNSKKDIVKASKSKFSASINDSNVVEYKIDDLIKEGYLDKKNKKEYKNTKVLVTKENGKVIYNLIEGNTLYDIISSLNTSDGLYKEKENYIYKGINANNYISFNKEIYRIIKTDKYRNIYIIKDIDNKIINKDNIDNYKNSYFNDNYSQIVKENILSIDILDYADYKNSFINDDTYIYNTNDIWIKHNNEYKVLSTNELTNYEKANIRYVLKIKSNVTITNGDGTSLSPYIID